MSRRAKLATAGETPRGQHGGNRQGLPPFSRFAAKNMLKWSDIRWAGFGQARFLIGGVPVADEVECHDSERRGRNPVTRGVPALIRSRRYGVTTYFLPVGQYCGIDALVAAAPTCGELVSDQTWHFSLARWWAV